MIKCYVSFDKSKIFRQVDGNFVADEMYGGVYDYFQNARILRTANGFILQMEVYDDKGVPQGLQFAKKLELDAGRFKCSNVEGCAVMDGLKYDDVVEKAKSANPDTEEMLKVQDKFNAKYSMVLEKFWKSHQAVLLLDEYCLKVNKVLLYAQIQEGQTSIVYDEKFYNLGKFKIINLDVDNYEACPYRLTVELNRKCIMRKWFGLPMQE